MISKDKHQIKLSIDKELLKAIEIICKESGLTKSEFFSIAAQIFIVTADKACKESTKVIQ